jgi:hypothetical protein
LKEEKKQILEEEMGASAVNGQIPCAVAFRIAEKLKLVPRVIGDKANELKVRIINCQLGCFYVEKATHEDLEGRVIDPRLTGEVQAALVQGKLPCRVAFQIAEKLKAGRKQVGDAATKLKIKIADCQLGCFS